MYCVLGADGEEYGPVKGEVLRHWITEGHGPAQRGVLPEVSTERQMLASVAGVEAFFPAAAAAPVGVVAPGEVKSNLGRVFA